MNSETVRASLRDLMRATVKQQTGWHYQQLRPLKLDLTTLHVPVFTDCSGGIVLLCKWAGAPDPSGNNYDGVGNSQSFFYHLPHIRHVDVEAGDIIVFGVVDGERHAVMVYEPGVDPLVWSHGQEAGPILVALSAEANAHPGMAVTFLRNLPAAPKPVPAPEPVRVNVSRDGRLWLSDQKVSNPALWARVKQAAKSARSITVRRAK